jgi:hypothetical protein
MCIFCGGTCGGVGDALIPFVGAGISAAVIQIRGRKLRRKQNLAADSQDEPTTPDTEVNDPTPED